VIQGSKKKKKKKFWNLYICCIESWIICTTWYSRTTN